MKIKQIVLCRSIGLMKIFRLLAKWFALYCFERLFQTPFGNDEFKNNGRIKITFQEEEYR